jgi:hypothetical protein
MTSPRIVLSLVLATGPLFASCATGVTRVELRDPFPAVAVDDAVSPVALLAVRDLRPDPLHIGVKRNTSGEAVGAAELESERPLADLAAEHLAAAFAAQGFALRAGAAEDGVPGVAVEIHRLWAEFRPGTWAGEAEAEIELRLEVARAGSPTQVHTFDGKAFASSPAGASALLDRALNGAYADVLKALQTELAADAPGSLGSLLRAAR